MPPTTTEASRYQQLRGHLAYLKLADAAEALPAVLDTAQAEKLSTTATLEKLLRIEVQATEARRLTGRLRFANLPTAATLDDFDYDAQPGRRPRPDRGPGVEPVPGHRHQYSADRATRGRQNDARHGPGPPGRGGRSPHLLHQRRRPLRPLPPGRDRGPLGHYHAVLRRTGVPDN